MCRGGATLTRTSTEERVVLSEVWNVARVSSTVAIAGEVMSTLRGSGV